MAENNYKTTTTYSQDVQTNFSQTSEFKLFCLSKYGFINADAPNVKKEVTEIEEEADEVCVIH